MVTNTNQLLSELYKTSPKLAEIVDQIIGDLELNDCIDNGSKGLYDHLGESIDRFASKQPINFIPFNSSGACHEICICMALGKWNSQIGFSGICKETIEYWLGCFMANKSTVIFTSAWDQEAFEAKYEKAIDNYSLGGPHNVAIILVTPKDMSLVYSI